MDYLCPLCNRILDYYGDARYYDVQSSFETPLLFCKNCDLFQRVISDSSRKSHFYAASYTNLNNERDYFRQRKHFFEHILSIIKNEGRDLFKSDKPLLVDFGSSYGHLLEIEVVTLLDSLYLVADPIGLFQDIRKILVDEGIVFMRVVNRNWLLKIKNLISAQKKFGNLLGDCIIGHSFKSLSLLLDKTGFRISKILFHEKGKKFLV